jgi:electron transfer flavoprotein alpha subunit
MNAIVLVEHDGSRIRPGSRSAITAARELAEAQGGGVELLVLGSDLEEVALEASRLAPTIVAVSSSLQQPRADCYARVIADVCRDRACDLLLAASTTFAKDIVPRVAALLEAPMASDVTGYSFESGQLLLRRPMYAGSVTATVALVGRPNVITVRASAFPQALPGAIAFERINWTIEQASLVSRINHITTRSRPTERPELTEARVVVAGGRPFRSSEEFEAYVGRLADRLGGAAGCTRALVDAGVAPNEWQVGQTGKVVAPELYIALGISGAVQHLAGMKNSRIVVAINSDPQAPIFGIADYGLVGDVRSVVPQMIELLGQGNCGLE